MSNQVRDLTQRSISKYVDFFRRFRKPNAIYPTPEEVIAREYDPDAEFESTFLTLKLEMHSQDGIKFNDDYTTLLQDLVKVVPFMIDKINSIPRPDLGFRNPDQTHLWDIQPDDELVQNAMKEVKEVLMEHLGVTQKVINVYDEFLFVNNEKANVEEFLEKKPYSRQEFLERIDKYQNTINKIKTSMPFEIRMSMFLVECEDINNKLVEELEQLITLMLNKITDYVQHDLATKVQTEVRTI